MNNVEIPLVFSLQVKNFCFSINLVISQVIAFKLRGQKCFYLVTGSIEIRTELVF